MPEESDAATNPQEKPEHDLSRLKGPMEEPIIANAPATRIIQGISFLSLASACRNGY
ncbi:hypothetical protein ABK905_08820 [Acerihabitans sp. KWT182]|uniref:Uncharacterized protein n=1 Tax=Acerihabitans sp. KWT182 TaxID=3157919 RepID=A0AAU7QD67_9GAMM